MFINSTFKKNNPKAEKVWIYVFSLKNFVLNNFKLIYKNFFEKKPGYR